METRKLSLTDAHALAMRCLESNGCDHQNAEPVADSMLAAERDGCASHGLFRLPGYVTGLRSGAINGTARPTTEHLAPAVIKVHGDRAMAPVAHAVAFGELAEAAHTVGMAALAVCRVHHFSALWVELDALAQHDLVGFACTSYIPVMAPAGGASPTFGTNPIAFGWPRANGEPMIFDMATAAKARGEIMLAERAGEKLPPGVGVDRDGKPTDDPTEILQGAQLAFGGYKGSAFALMVELLAGPLIGETLSVETQAADRGDGAPPPGGEFILALAPERFGDAASWQSHAEQLFDRIESMPGARLPSGRRYVNRPRAEADGIDIPATLLSRIEELVNGP